MEHADIQRPACVAQNNKLNVHNVLRMGGAAGDGRTTHINGSRVPLMWGSLRLAPTSQKFAYAIALLQ